MKVFTILLFTALFQIAHSGENHIFGIGVVNSCSAGLIKLSSMDNHQKALIITNGHCLLLNHNYNRDKAYLEPNEYIENVQDFNFLTKTIIRVHSTIGTTEFIPKKLVFATMTGTDIAIFELDESYQELKIKYDIMPLEISKTSFPLGNAVQIQSGYYNRLFSCAISDFVNLEEGPFYTKNAIQLTEKCDIYPGVSGSPIVEKSSGLIIGLANTHSSGEGGICGFNNPCIVLKNNERKIFKQPTVGTSFGVSLAPLYGCYDFSLKEFNFNLKTCLIKE